jgi:hypothetical protein
MEPISYIRECLVREMRASEVHKVTSFRVQRTREDGKQQEVDVKILDAGETVNPSYRFSCEARGEDGTFATGNPAESVATAIDLVHWSELDKEEPT